MFNRYALAGLLSVLGVIAIVALPLAVFGGTDEAPVPSATPGPVDLDAAVQSAGCALSQTPNEGAAHGDKAFTAADYRVNPPTSGPHTPEWAPDGVYKPGETPELGNLVHTLEHGRINIQYRKGTPAETIERLETLVLEFDDGYHQLLYENTTGMEYAVAATAWDRLLSWPEINDRVLDAVRAFRKAFVDQGPEKVP